MSVRQTQTEFLASANESQLIPLRPTLIIGLGGTGGKVALELKARLQEQEQLGPDYNRLVKFVYFDTATENLLTYQPHHPELSEVRLMPGSEFVRVSDVPLHDLMESKADGSAMASILPEILYSTQIDQGAQQVRRLGRVAFFYHYNRIKLKLEQVIRELRNPTLRDVGSLNKRFRIHDRLRIFLVCSICGGTGGGMFIDMAYLIRRIASAGTSSPREVDLVGMLLLPEAFPEVRTTGEGRIRANAYASLLDLEYYNQPVLDGRPIQTVAYPTETVPFEGSPFSLCYLVTGSSSKWELNGSGEIAPVLADVLQTMVSTRIGEQLDATLDNVRTYSLNQYIGGYRTFYSAVGIAQLIYPRVWLQQQCARQLQAALINQWVTRPSLDFDQSAVTNWFNEHLASRAMRDRLLDKLEMSPVTARLSQLRRDVNVESDLATALRNAYEDALRQFQQQIVTQMQNNANRVLNDLSVVLKNQIDTFVDNAHQPSIVEGGLSWTLKWLEGLEALVNSTLDELRKRTTLRDSGFILSQYLNDIDQAESIPTIVGRSLARRRTRHACTELKKYIEDTLRFDLLDRYTGDTLSQLRLVIRALYQKVSFSLAAWEYARPALLEQEQPHFTALTQSILSAQQGKEIVESAVEQILNPHQMSALFNTISQEIGNLSRSLDPAFHAAYVNNLQLFCARRAREITNEKSVAAELDDKDGLLLTLGEQAQPLIVYREGRLQKIPPSQINIVGAQTVEAARNIRERIHQTGDVTAIATGDGSIVTYLTTHHGIPAKTLNKFDEYARHYQRLRTESRDAIFHLDNERESRPYNPDSLYFFTPDDLQMDFARAVGYGWIVRLREARLNIPSDERLYAELFVFENDFKNVIENLVNTEINRLKNELGELTKLRNPSVDVLEKINFCQMVITELESYLPCWKNVYVAKPSFSNSIDRGFALMKIVNQENIVSMQLSETLEQALTAVGSGKSRVFPVLFGQAIDVHYATETRRWNTHAQDFVNRRTDESQQFRPEWTTKGQISFEIEQRIFNLLRAFGRTLGKDDV